MSSRLRHGLLISMTVIALLLTSLTVSYAETVNYFCDDLHRLIRVEYGSGVSIEYTYDQFGNRLQEVIRDIGAPTTTASPVGGIYNAPQTVTLTCSDGYGSGCDKIYYTTNGSTPTTSSPVYSSPINISVTTTLKFFAKDLAGNSEAVKTQNYIIDVPNRAPVALNDSYATSENVTLNIAAPGVLTNDNDPDGDSLTAILVSGPTHGTLTLNSNGSFTYTPNGNYNGPDSFTYKANDGKADSNVATVSIAVNPVNSQPVAISQPVTTGEDTPKGITLTGSDLETPAASLIFAVTSGPTHGTLSGTVPNLTYTPKKDYNGSDSFKFTVTDRGYPDNCGLVGSGCAAPKISPEATVSITINPVNDVPIANNQPVTTDEDVAKTITLSASDVDSTSLSFSIASGASSGSLGSISFPPSCSTSGGIITCTATVTYIPNLNFNGFDTFTYTATDPEGGVSDPATVTITVNPVNDAPMTKDDSYSTDEDTPLTVNATLGVLANDSDVDTGETLTAIKVSGPTHGGLTFNTDGSFIYTPNPNFSGTDTFTYMIFDGSLYSNEATVTITVNEVNKAPVLADPGDRAVNEGEVLGFTLSATDPDLPANTLAYSISAGSVAGMSLDPSTGAFSWIPTEAQGPGSYTIIFRVTDSGTPPLSNEKTITITVNEVNSAPTLAAIGNKTVDELTLLSFTAVGSDKDIPAQTLTYSLANGTTNCGSVTSCTVPSGASINSSGGAFTWTPTEAQGPGTYRFKVVVTDNGSPNLSASEEITVTVNEVNAALTLSVNPASVIGGVSSTGKVILASPAPAGGVVVTLSSSDTNIAAVPASVNVSAGTTSKTFSVTTKAVAASTPVTISATYKGSTANAVLTVNPAMLTSFSVSPPTVLGGNTSKGTVALNGKAPASGALVTLTSANAAATVPANVLIPAGSTSATFTINTTPVTATEGPFNISAFYQGVTRKARLTVQVATLSKLVVSPASVIGGVVSMGTVALNGKAPAGGAAVSLSSANAAATVPASLTIPAGSTSATFSITTTSVAADRGPFKISATYNGVTASDTLKVMAADLSTLTLNPTSVIGGNPVMGTVTLNGAAPTAGTVVKLKSYNTAVATVPASVTVPAGSSSITFAVNTSPVKASTSTTISASAGGVTKKATLRVLKPWKRKVSGLHGLLLKPLF